VLKVMPDRAKAEVMEEYPTLRFAQPVFIGTGLVDTAAAPEFHYGIAAAACRAGRSSRPTIIQARIMAWRSMPRSSIRYRS